VRVGTIANHADIFTINIHVVNNNEQKANRNQDQLHFVKRILINIILAFSNIKIKVILREEKIINRQQ
jgi:hypothetical protein